MLKRFAPAILVPLAACATPAPESSSASPAAVAADSARVYAIAEVTTRPTLANGATVAQAIRSNFPAVLAASPAGGTVHLSLVVDETGATRDISVVRSPDPQFNVPAIRVVRSMRFRPARLNGAPVAVRLELPVAFTPAN